MNDVPWIRVCRDPESLRSNTTEGPVVGPYEVWQMLRSQAEQDDQEGFYVIALDTRYRARGVQQVTKGLLTSTPVHPREVFRAALILGAKCVIIAHNHPAGSLRPSSADREVTERLREAGDLLGVPVVDHVIVTEKGYWSFAEHGELGA